MLRWCESHQVNYIVGIAKNERLQALSAKLQQRAERKYYAKVRLFGQLKYKAGTWDCREWVG
jgi:Transposase DDE domain group 1